jgi:signal transduction histidine kinase
MSRVGRRLGSSLFLKIYVTLLASLAVVAVVSALFVRLGQDEQDTGWRERRDHFVAAMLPADAPLTETQLVLDRLAAAIEGEIFLIGPDGAPIASAGRLPPPGRDRDGRRWRDRDDFPLEMRLPDGRLLVVRTGMPFGPVGRSPLLYMALIAAAIGLAAYPVVRHLTRRLERLRRGVETWGDGKLSTRVDDGGSDEIAAVAQTFNKAASQIERMLEAHRSLLANASHELRSPLARLRMAIDLFQETGNEKTRDEIVRNLAELDSLVEEILLASRLDHVDGLDHRERVDLLAIVAEEGVRSGVAVDGVGAMVLGDPRLLLRLVRNLMQNALRHGAPPVEALVERVGDTVRLSVRDHGAGVPEGEGERVFEAFYRPSGRSESAGGWGLGLSLVRQIARHHGASVRYERPADGGARFVVEFPAKAS